MYEDKFKKIDDIGDIISYGLTGGTVLYQTIDKMFMRKNVTLDDIKSAIFDTMYAYIISTGIKNTFKLKQYMDLWEKYTNDETYNQQDGQLFNNQQNNINRLIINMFKMLLLSLCIGLVDKFVIGNNYKNMTTFRNVLKIVCNIFSIATFVFLLKNSNDALVIMNSLTSGMKNGFVKISQNDSFSLQSESPSPLQTLNPPGTENLTDYLTPCKLYGKRKFKRTSKRKISKRISKRS